MMLAPLIMGYISIDKKHNLALPIRQDNIKNPRYFSRAFKALVEAALQKYAGQGTVYLSRDENLCFARDIPAGIEQFDSLVVAFSTFRRKSMQNAGPLLVRTVRCVQLPAIRFLFSRKIVP